jgi:hypothetical protein
VVKSWFERNDDDPLAPFAFEFDFASDHPGEEIPAAAANRAHL